MKVFLAIALAFAAFWGVGMDYARGEEQKAVGVLWIGESSMAERVLKGFLFALKQKAPNISAEIKMSLPDEATAAKVYADFQKSKAAIVFLRKSGAAFLNKNSSVIPAFVGAIDTPAELVGKVGNELSGNMNNTAFALPDEKGFYVYENLLTTVIPASARALRDVVGLGGTRGNNGSAGNITGVTSYLPVKKNFHIYKKLYPNMKVVALFVAKGDPSSAVDVEQTREECEKAGLECMVAECTSEDDITKQAVQVKDKADLIILGNQSLIIDNAVIVAAEAASKPVASFSDIPVMRRLAMLGFAVDDEKLGEMLADSVIDVVVNNKPISAVPVKMNPQPRLLINQDRAANFGLSIPEELKMGACFLED